MTKFQKDCVRVSTEMDVLVFFCHGEKGTAYYEDDGCLHIRKSGLRACFDVSPGQNLSGADQNANTRKVMTALGLEKHIRKALVDETEEDDEDVCECCGRPL